MNMNKKFGFTLIELLTVVLILGILTSIALPQYRKSIQRAEAANALISLKTIFDSAKRYKSSHSEWPTSFDGLDVELLDVAENNGEMGEFAYSFSGDDGGTVSACRLRDNAATGTYCLTASYAVNGERDVYKCTSNDTKYDSLCQSMSSSCTGQSCTIN